MFRRFLLDVPWILGLLGGCAYGVVLAHPNPEEYQIAMRIATGAGSLLLIYFTAIGIYKWWSWGASY